MTVNQPGCAPIKKLTKIDQYTGSAKGSGEVLATSAAG
jgi:hypothetical protein